MRITATQDRSHADPRSRPEATPTKSSARANQTHHTRPCRSKLCLRKPQPRWTAATQIPGSRPEATPTKAAPHQPDAPRPSPVGASSACEPQPRRTAATQIPGSRPEAAPTKAAPHQPDAPHPPPVGASSACEPRPHRTAATQIRRSRPEAAPTKAAPVPTRRTTPVPCRSKLCLRTAAALNHSHAKPQIAARGRSYAKAAREPESAPREQPACRPGTFLGTKKNLELRWGRGKFEVQIRTARARSRDLPTLNTTRSIEGLLHPS